jgi:hypothetical protein
MWVQLYSGPWFPELGLQLALTPVHSDGELGMGAPVVPGLFIYLFFILFFIFTHRNIGE